uniref:Uncharacterized protein n=1 Tax=Schizaphis graminum TaxID=13262 RepID=A0A2S2PNH9_SCHGA
MSDSFFSPPRYFAAITTRTVQCMSPDLFPAIYNPADYTLRVVERKDQDERSSLGFEAGQHFPWVSPADTDSPCILGLLSREFPHDNEISNDAQSFHWSDTAWSSSDEGRATLHWKKKIISRFDLNSM